MKEIKQLEQAILVSLETGNEDEDRAALDELKELVYTAGAEIVGVLGQRRHNPDRATFLGKGKAEELFLEVKETDADLVIINADLSPTQQRNLVDILQIRVIDRTQLILDIFAGRAHTSEGKLQVELALMSYLLPRLKGMGTSLSQQGGGIGTRGPGETKLEVDRRRIREHITALKDELEVVKKHRQVQRQARKRLPFPSAAIVGYTSAGKSTLLNTLSGSDVLVDAKLFATLDPTTRKVDLPDGWALLLTDTVGFIRNLPHHLVAAFRATLEEVTEADFLIHVVDASHPRMLQQMEAVNKVLEELNSADKPTVTIFNKADLVEDQYELRRIVADTPNSVYISALKREGLDQLMRTLSHMLQTLLARLTLEIPYDRSDLVSLCYDTGKVLKIEYTTESIHVEAEVSREIAGKLEKYRVDI